MSAHFFVQQSYSPELYALESHALKGWLFLRAFFKGFNTCRKSINKSTL